MERLAHYILEHILLDDSVLNAVMSLRGEHLLIVHRYIPAFCVSELFGGGGVHIVVHQPDTVGLSMRHQNCHTGSRQCGYTVHKGSVITMPHYMQQFGYNGITLYTIILIYRGYTVHSISVITVPHCTQ